MCPSNSSRLLNVFQDAISRDNIEKECITVRNPSLVLLSGTLKDEGNESENNPKQNAPSICNY